MYNVLSTIGHDVVEFFIIIFEHFVFLITCTCVALLELLQPNCRLYTHTQVSMVMSLEWKSCTTSVTQLLFSSKNHNILKQVHATMSEFHTCTCTVGGVWKSLGMRIWFVCVGGVCCICVCVCTCVVKQTVSFVHLFVYSVDDWTYYYMNRLWKCCSHSVFSCVLSTWMEYKCM